MRESVLQKKILKRLKAIDGLWFAKLSDRFTAGLPDIVLCYQGVPGAMEIKADDGKLTTLQEITLQRMQFAGYRVAVVRSMFEVERFLGDLCSERGQITSTSLTK